MSREVGKAMLEQGKGSIVNVASMSGLIVNTPQNQCAYNAAKGGLIMLTKSMAAEWAGRGVRVNALCPGYMRTEMSEERYQRKDPAIQRWFSMTPMGRSGQPEELKGIVVYLASEASSFVTGATFLVDGGYTAW
jgi:NAD(P)-dependent dehydrogenase (short-subunit alcohol dehydrogenase family)